MKVTPKVAEEIRVLHAQGTNVHVLTARFGVSLRTVYRSLNRENARYTKEPIAARFMRKVRVLGDDECHEWLAAKNPAGYGVFGIWRDGQTDTVLASRFAYQLANGEIAPGLEVRHRCDNPSCVNPRHLELGTHMDNMRDMFDRERHNMGNRPSKGLTSETARIARELHKIGWPLSKIAALLECSVVTVHRVVRGERWAEPTPPVMQKPDF